MPPKPAKQPAPRSRPRPDWEPPYPAHSSRFGSNVRRPVIAYFGCQSAEVDSGLQAVDALREHVKRGTRPDYCDRSHYKDGQGFFNEVLIGYWHDEARYDAWLADSGFVTWLNHPDRLIGSAGIWHETICVPLERLETIAGKPEYGIARAATNVESVVREHAYFGSMRHRIEIASVDPLESSHQGLRSPARPETKAALIRIAPPANLAVIRSGQDWSRCAGEELETYLGDVHPRLIDGMNFLRDHPEETGCCACRFMEERDEDGEKRAASFGLAMFLSLQHLEAWSKSHPTHLAIFNSFHRMIQRHKNARGLRLWHEVCVLEEGNRAFVYVNCHAETGLLRWFASEGSTRT